MVKSDNVRIITLILRKVRKKQEYCKFFFQNQELKKKPSNTYIKQEKQKRNLENKEKSRTKKKRKREKKNIWNNKKNQEDH